MTEAKGCFLLVSVGRPCVSLPTTDGERQWGEEGGKTWRSGEIEEERGVRRREGKEAESIAHREREVERQRSG